MSRLLLSMLYSDKCELREECAARVGQVLSVKVPEISRLCNSNVSGSNELPTRLCDPHTCGSVPLIHELPTSRLLIELVLANIISLIVPDIFDLLASR